MAAYSRKVTVAWTGYFVADGGALARPLSRSRRSTPGRPFANLVTPLAMVLMFVGEYLLRYRLHPEFERATLAQAVRAYRRPRAPHD